MMLTDPEFIKKLEMLSLLARKVIGGNLKADRKSQKKGSGINFSDYQEYNYGDDYRNIDWNIAARLEQMVVKLFELEEDVSIYILLDLSKSMQSKLLFAKQLTAALGYIALNNQDKLTIYGLADELKTIIKPSHGRGHIFPMLESLENAETYGHDTRFEECMRTFQVRHKRPGVCVLISDFFVKEGYKDALNFLRWSKNDIFAIQVLDPKELQCDLRGDVDLECIETGNNQVLTISPLEAAKFAEAVKEWNDNLQKECARSGIGYVRTMADVPFEDVIQSILRRGGLVA